MPELTLSSSENDSRSENVIDSVSHARNCFVPNIRNDFGNEIIRNNLPENKRLSFLEGVELNFDNIR